MVGHVILCSVLKYVIKYLPTYGRKVLIFLWFAAFQAHHRKSRSIEMGDKRAGNHINFPKPRYAPTTNWIYLIYRASLSEIHVGLTTVAPLAIRQSVVSRISTCPGSARAAARISATACVNTSTSLLRSRKKSVCFTTECLMETKVSCEQNVFFYQNETR